VGLQQTRHTTEGTSGVGFNDIFQEEWHEKVGVEDEMMMKCFFLYFKTKMGSSSWKPMETPKLRG